MKELVRSTGQNRLDDLTVRQVAYVLALVTPWVLPSDLVEIGGQSESCLQACCDSLLHSCNPPPPEAGCLSFEYLRAIQVAKEQLLMESMTMHRRQKNKEMQSSCLEKVSQRCYILVVFFMFLCRHTAIAGQGSWTHLAGQDVLVDLPSCLVLTSRGA